MTGAAFACKAGFWSWWLCGSSRWWDCRGGRSILTASVGWWVLSWICYSTTCGIARHALMNFQSCGSGKKAPQHAHDDHLPECLLAFQKYNASKNVTVTPKQQGKVLAGRKKLKAQKVIEGCFVLACFSPRIRTISLSLTDQSGIPVLLRTHTCFILYKFISTACVDGKACQLTEASKNMLNTLNTHAGKRGKGAGRGKGSSKGAGKGKGADKGKGNSKGAHTTRNGDM